MHTAEDTRIAKTHSRQGDLDSRKSAPSFLPLQPLRFEDIRIRGELACRSLLNFARLEGKWYRPEEVFSADQHGWPGDWVGRLVLGLTLLARATHREPAYLQEILSRVPENLNAKGYFGPILPASCLDEQQLSGHSWYIRGLLEYYDWTHDDSVMPLLQNVIEHLLLPARGSYAKYPLDPESRRQTRQWRLSNFTSKDSAAEHLSDVGCAFIMLDGATHAYQVLGRPALRELVEEMIARYAQIDLLALKVQTHATLSGLRGILRMHELTGQEDYLNLVVQTFEFYKQEAMSAAYGNYNWFGRPCWTEPCAIIDAFTLAVQLFRLTGQSTYLNDAQCIYYNAFLRGQRANGGFGSDRCVGAKSVAATEFLTTVNYESYWCCTMRSGEGFARAIQSQYLTDGKRVVVPFYESGLAEIRLETGKAKFQQRTSFPFENTVTIEVIESVGEPVEMALFVPPGVSSATLHLNKKPLAVQLMDHFLTTSQALTKGDSMQLTFEMAPRAVGVIGNNNQSDYHAFSLGPALLGVQRVPRSIEPVKDWYSNDINLKCESPEPLVLSSQSKFNLIRRGVFQNAESGSVFSLLCDTRQLSQPDTLQQVLFKSTPQPREEV